MRIGDFAGNGEIALRITYDGMGLIIHLEDGTWEFYGPVMDARALALLHGDDPVDEVG